MPNLLPSILIKPSKIRIYRSQILSENITIPNDYKNKQLCLWVTKIGNTYKAKLCNYISTIVFTELQSLFAYPARSIKVPFTGTYLSRIGIKKAGYDFDSIAFKTVIAAEYKRGTYIV